MPELPAKTADELYALLERACVTLKVAQRAYAATKADLKETKKKLRLLQARHQGLVNHTETETSRRNNAEGRTATEEQLERLQSQLHAEIASREASESARRAAESDAASYKDLYLRATATCRFAQSIAESKENEVVALEARPHKVERPLQCRLDDVRKGREMDKDQSFVVQLAMEGLLAREGDSVFVASRMPSVNVCRRRREVESWAMPLLVSIEDGQDSAARALRASADVRSKVRRLQDQLLLFRRQEEREMDRRCLTVRRGAR